ncbi:MAG: PEP-CTERM sorting domain-containing protein [Phycisphaerales bacterium]
MKDVSTLCVVVILVSGVAAYGATVLHYDFEDGTPNTPMNDYPVTQQNGVVGTVDLSGNGYDMLAWDDYWGPMFSSEGDTPTGAGLSSFHDGHRDGYAPADGIRAWSPSTWTIELSFKYDDPAGWRTLIGRDDWTTIPDSPEAALYIQSNGIDNAIRLNFATVSNERIVTDSTLIPEPGKWYHLAIVADGDQIDMYADQFDGLGFQNIGSLTMAAGVDHSLQPTGTWTFGRGWWNGNFVDHISGNLDNIRFSDVALTTDQFIPEPATLVLLGLGGLMLRRRRK